MEVNMSWFRNAVKSALVLGSISAFSAWAQPVPAPTTGDEPCADSDEKLVVHTDTVNSGGGVDPDGYFPLFDGTFKGWFHSCETGHSGGSRQGAIFRIGQADGKPAIYSTQRGTGTGGLLMSKRYHTNYEITFQTWPDYGNDAGLFNRTTMNGRCFQTVLDYIGGAAVGGTWGEGGFTGRDFRPYSFGGSEQAIGIPGLTGGNELNDWTLITKKLKATTEPNLPCDATGCTKEKWASGDLWDFNGWMDIKVQFYGGLNKPVDANDHKNYVHMKSWFKKIGSTVWVPVLQDTTLPGPVGQGYIGLQVHGGGRFGGAKGTWYRNIRWKPLDDLGVVIPQKPKDIVAVNPIDRVKYSVYADEGALIGKIDQRYEVTVKNVTGRTLESFAGQPGAFHHDFATSTHGVMFVDIKTARSTETVRIVRPSR